MSKNIIEEVIETICTMPATNELAYLAITSKPEFIVRDYAASKLHSKHANTKIIAREYNLKCLRSDERKKVDLVIFDEKQKPELFIEFKASIAEDACATECHHLISDLCNDLKRIQKIEPTPTLGVMTFVHVYGLLTDLRAEINDSVFKYLKWFKKFESRTDMSIHAAMQIALKHFESNGMKILSTHGTKVGKVWGATVELHHVFIQSIDR